MKTQIFSLALLGTFAGLCSGCFQPLEEVDNGQTEAPSNLPKTTLKLNTRSATGIIDYPVMVLAYDADGNKSAQQILSSADDVVKLKLAVGAYHLSAITGYSAFVEPVDYSTSDAVFSMPSVGYAESPLFVGSADVELSDKTAAVDVLLSSRCASLEIALHDLPETVSSTSVAIARQSASLGMDGQLSSSIIARPVFTKTEDGVWTTDKFYVFPGSEAQTVLTITIVDDDQQFSYGYTVNEPLMAAVPYTLKGTYKGGERVESFDLSGSLTVENWKDPKAFDFEFGEGASIDNTPSSGSDKMEEEAVSTIPSAYSVWNGHVVGLVMNETTTEADLLLVSLQEQVNVYSANAPNHEYDALNMAAAYSEGDLTGWSIPTNFQMQELKKAYKDADMSKLNSAIVQAGGTGLSLVDAKGEPVRYLCDSGLQAIGFSSGSNIGKAGKTVKYSLRFVKKVHVSVNQ